MNTEELNTLINVGNTIAENLLKEFSISNIASFSCLQAQEYHDNYGKQGIRLIFRKNITDDNNTFKTYISEELVKAGYTGIEVILEW